MRKAFLSGNLTKDPELKNVGSSEYGLITFDIANNDESKKTDSGYENITSYYTIKFWTKSPQPWLQKLTKGTPVAVECDIKQERWESENGNRSKITFTIFRGSFPLILARKSDSGYTPPAPQQSAGYEDEIVPF